MFSSVQNNANSNYQSSEDTQSNETQQVLSIPSLTGLNNSLRNFGEFNRFPTQFHVVRHFGMIINEETSIRAGIWDVVKSIYNLVLQIFRNPERYEKEPPNDCREVDLTKSYHQCPIMHYDIFLIIQTLRITGIFDPKMIARTLRINRQLDGEAIKVSKNYEQIGMLTDPVLGDGRTPFTAKNEAYQTLKKFLRPNLLCGKIYQKEGIDLQLKQLSDKILLEVRGANEGIIKDVAELTFTLPSEVIQCLLFGKVIPKVQNVMWDMLMMIRRIIGTLGTQAQADTLKNTEGFQFIKELIRKVKETPEEYPGVLSQMSQKKTESGENQFDQDDLFATMLFFFTAGEDTLSSAINSMFYELGFQQDTQEKLYQTLLPYYEDYTVILLDTLDKIPFLDYVVKEVLRLYPALPILARDINPNRPEKVCPIKMQSPDGSGHYHLDETRNLWLYIFESNRDPKYWKNGEQFIPERWEQKEEYQTKTENYLTFGIGPNRCLGENLARLQLKALLYYFLREFQFVTRKKVNFNAEITLVPDQPVSLKVTSRK